jgi:DHA1 family bicyclomycin/chloramphenicol resistance-like MFS transporter
MAGWYGLPQVILLLFLFLGCLGFTNPNAAALCLAPFSKNAGTAASLLGCLQLGIGALASAGVSAFSNGASATPMIAVIAVTSLVAMGILIIGRKSGKLNSVVGPVATGPLPH